MNKSLKKLVICGDSFSIGIGCRNLKTEPYGSLLSNKLGMELVNLAKGSSSNLSIFLQVKYAINNIDNIGLLIIAPTCHYRTEFFNKKTQYGNVPIREIDNTCVNYHQYPPYGDGTYLPDQILKNPMENDPNYNPIIFTENFHGIFDFINVKEKNIETNYYNRFDNEDINRIRVLKDYCVDFHHSSIQKWYDIGAINLGQSLLNKNLISYLIIDNDHEMLSFVPEKNRCYVDWGDLSIKYPDDLPSSHTSYEGHLHVYNTILEKLKNENSDLL